MINIIIDLLIGCSNSNTSDIPATLTNSFILNQVLFMSLKGLNNWSIGVHSVNESAGYLIASPPFCRLC